MVVPYVDLLDGRDPVDVLAATPAQLSVWLARLTPEQIEHRPAPGKWSLREVMAHLADCEIAWSWRLRQVYAEENPMLQPFDQDAWARAYAGYSMAQARSAWEALRAWNLAFLRGLVPADRSRPAQHPEIGSITLWTVASIAAGHDLHHLRSLERAVLGFAVPAATPAAMV